MTALAPADLLDLWERGPTSALCAVLPLAAACGESADALAALPVGQRDARLLRLRALTFGPVMEGETACPACGERLDLAVHTDDLLAAAPADPAPAWLTAEADGTTVAYRLPTTHDLAAAVHAADPAAALLRRCLRETPDALPDAVVDAVARGMAEADPLAAIRWDLECPACGHGWQDVFDVAAYFWAEIERHALRLLAEVHRLALAYGWAERDVLALSFRRRYHYLALLNG